MEYVSLILMVYFSVALYKTFQFYILESTLRKLSYCYNMSNLFEHVRSSLSKGEKFEDAFEYYTNNIQLEYHPRFDEVKIILFAAFTLRSTNIKNYVSDHMFFYYDKVLKGSHGLKKAASFYDTCNLKWIQLKEPLDSEAYIGLAGWDIEVEQYLDFAK